MAKDYSKGFYNSKKWKQCRSVYLANNPYCERCLASGTLVPAEHVHHKVYISEQNINDVNVTLNFDNLESLCHDCHTKEHKADNQVNDGFMFDSHGNLVPRGHCEK